MTYWPVIFAGLLLILVAVIIDRLGVVRRLVLFRDEDPSQRKKRWRTERFYRQCCHLLDKMNCPEEERLLILDILFKVKSDVDLSTEEVAAVEIIDAKITEKRLSRGLIWINILGVAAILAILGRILISGMS